MRESVRLVIWDLDETFWEGTLSEGGVNTNSHHGEIVRQLNERGIMNSICSKNDFEQTKEFLENLGLWDQFIFPSIDWTPKGHRVEEIVRKVQLRPETVMFIDDNPMNLAEVRSVLPAIQVENEHFISKILDDHLFRGKPDPEKSRLANYKMMEAKSQALDTTGGDNLEFLRTSGITVEMDYDLEKNIDRAIEIINRTNQLNFTKKRLSDQPDLARQEFRGMINGGLFEHTALIRVRDNFGDYGLVGFLQQVHHSTENRLDHFCFSCRTLGMHIETWLYNQLGRPQLDIVGEVANNPIIDDVSPDWISWYEKKPDGKSGQDIMEFSERPPIAISGGCESESIQHYIGHVTEQFKLYGGTVRDGFIVRRDHSSMVRIAVERNMAAQEQLIRAGYKAEDFQTSFDDIKNGMIVLSFWADIPFKIYKLSWIESSAPYSPPGIGHGNFQEIYEDEYFARGGTEEYQLNFRFAKSNFKYKGNIKSEEFKDNLNAIISKIDRSNKIVLLLPAITVPDPHPEWGFLDQARILYACQIEVSKKWENVCTVCFDDFFEDDTEVTSYDHFTRIVYQRCGIYLRDLYIQHCLNNG